MGEKRERLATCGLGVINARNGSCDTSCQNFANDKQTLGIPYLTIKLIAHIAPRHELVHENLLTRLVTKAQQVDEVRVADAR